MYLLAHKVAYPESVPSNLLSKSIPEKCIYEEWHFSDAQGPILDYRVHRGKTEKVEDGENGLQVEVEGVVN